MKAYSVSIQPIALLDVRDAHQWIKERAPEAADRWFHGISGTIEALCQMPFRCPKAPENGLADYEIRQQLYGDKRNAYRILFTVRGEEVVVLRVLHGRMRHLRKADL